MLTLKPVTAENWRACINLKVGKGQEGFVATNARSLAQAANSGEDWRPHAIYRDDDLVGFLMVGVVDYEGRDIWAFARLMIDESWQGNGYGREAVLRALDYMRGQPSSPTDVYISYVPENTAAAHLYAQLGFTHVGKTPDDTEEMMHLHLER